jgi:hypothetical protein
MWIAVAALTLLGLVLRLLAARGGLWLDEAWSATFAQQVGTPLGVVLKINHDNNHILNTLWLQMVGPDAPPMLQRGLSIACGTATIPLAAAFARRCGAVAAIVTAAGFAISPILVTYGSEARGYAPMIAAMLMMLVLVDRWLADRNAATPAGITVTALLGTLAQPLMVAVLAAITVWVFASLVRSDGFRRAIARTARALAPALIAAGAVIAIMALAAAAAPHGFTIGSYTAFSMRDWCRGLENALGWTLGFHPAGSWVLAGCAALIAAALWWWRNEPRTVFFAVAILAYPLALAGCHVGNVGIARYYLVAAVPLLLLLAAMAGAAVSRRKPERYLGAAAIMLFVIGSGRMDARILTELRADPSVAIAAVERAAPAGAIVMVPDGRLEPVLTWAARYAHYPLRQIPTGCRPAPFLLVDSDQPRRTLVVAKLCDGEYLLIAHRTSTGLSGTNWWLYRRIG